MFFKKVIFIVISFLMLWSGDPLLAQNELPLQGTPADFFHGQNPPLFLNFEGDIPEKVWKAANGSLVSVQVWARAISDRNIIYEKAMYGVGFCVWENFVLTNLHLFGEYPVLWRGTDDFPTVPWIFDSRDYFSAVLVFYDYRNDLALLKINTPNNEKKSFSHKPAKLFKMSVGDKDSLKHLSAYENFYAFGNHTASAEYLFPLKLGPFRSLTNVLPQGYLSASPMGILQGGVQYGFSGGPLYSPKGEVAGMVTLGTNLNIYVITTETIDRFLTAAIASLGLDSQGKPLSKSKEEKK